MNPLLFKNHPVRALQALSLLLLALLVPAPRAGAQLPPTSLLSCPGGEMTGYAYAANCGWIGLRGLKTKLAAGRDSDSGDGQTGDGIPDAWELEQLANAGLPSNPALLGSSPAADADHDGATDYEEYLADTNPFNGASLPVPPALDSHPDGSLTLSWDASPRRAYQVRCSQDLSTWLPEGAP